MARNGREVIDHIRVDQANLLRDNKTARKVVVKRSRWLLLRNAENLKDGQAVQLKRNCSPPTSHWPTVYLPPPN